MCSPNPNCQQPLTYCQRFSSDQETPSVPMWRSSGGINALYLPPSALNQWIAMECMVNHWTTSSAGQNNWDVCSVQASIVPKQSKFYLHPGVVPLTIYTLLIKTFNMKSTILTHFLNVNTALWTVGTMLYNRSLELTHLYNWNFIPIEHLLFSPLLNPGNHYSILCLYDLGYFDTSYKYNHKIFIVLFHLA